MVRFAVFLVFAMSGCSFVLVSGPPPNHRDLPVVDCTTSKIGPVLDTVWTVLQGLNLAFSIASSDQEVKDATNISRGVAIPLYAGLAALGAAGMYYGFSRTGECRRAKNELLLRQRTSPAGAPQPGTWPPPPAPASPTAPAPAPQPAPAGPPSP